MSVSTKQSDRPEIKEEQSKSGRRYDTSIVIVGLVTLAMVILYVVIVTTSNPGIAMATFMLLLMLVAIAWLIYLLL
jgi:uncharacterized Tic20 family protein